VARSISDLAAHDTPGPAQVAEAVQYRQSAILAADQAYCGR
jgi:predicted ATPase with chaperone activity